MDEQTEQTSDEDPAAGASKPGTDELKEKVKILVQRLTESSRREQDVTDRLRELMHSKDTPEQKLQLMLKLLAMDKPGLCSVFLRCYSFNDKTLPVTKFQRPSLTSFGDMEGVQK